MAVSVGIVQVQVFRAYFQETHHRSSAPEKREEK